MNFKPLFIACVSALWVSFPQNIIGCGPDADPYDYYSNLFMRNLPEDPSLKPFYYSSNVFLYDAFSEESPMDHLSKEWAAYCASPSVDSSAAGRFVFGYGFQEIRKLYAHAAGLDKTIPPDSLLDNPMAKWLVDHKDVEALQYLQYAKQVEPFVIGQDDYWEPIVRDSVKMARLIDYGKQLYNAEKRDFFKLRYAYQLVRLSLYSGRSQEAVDFYDRMLSGNPAKSILHPLSLSLKAGALRALGQDKEAAYLFSRAFAATPVRKYSNYISFRWTIRNEEEKEAYLSYCKSNEERAFMLGLMSVYGQSPELNTMKQVYQLDPASSMLELMAVREVNKAEESYYSRYLLQQPGGNILEYGWQEPMSEDIRAEKEKQISELGEWLHTVAVEKKVKQPGLFELAASYTAMMLRNWALSRERLDATSTMKLTEKQKEQKALINLLLTINDSSVLDREREMLLLPSLEWLKNKAIESKDATVSGEGNDGQWVRFYRTVLSEILAKKYRQQNNLLKEVLSVGAAEWIISQSAADSYWGIGFLRNNMLSKDVAALFDFVKSKELSPFEKFLVSNNILGETQLTDFAGTANLRDQNYAEAIKWLSMSASSNDLILKDPFIDILYDQSGQLPRRNDTTSKMKFAIEMLSLQKKAALKDKNEAKYLYKYALGLYNTSYYGYAWELVEYGRSGSDGYSIPRNANAFKREYYGCFSAHDFFKRAKEASPDRNFQARCLFMMARCKQKQFQQPNYADFSSGGYDVYSKALTAYYDNEFTNSPYFPQLVKEYGTTRFYREAYQSCSYLRDFVARSRKKR